MSTLTRGIWRLSADAGGTFTDVVALGPSGERRRMKVLSTGAVRRVVERVAGDRLRIALPFGGAGAVGASVRAPGGEARTVVAWDFLEGGAVELVLDSAFVGEPGWVELSTGEPAPVLAARLMLGVPVGERLAGVTLRLATTRATNALLERRTARAALLVTDGFADVLRIGDQRRPDLFALDIRKPEPVTELVYGVRGRLDASGGEVEPLDEAGARAALSAARSAGAETVAVALMHGWANPAHERRVAELARSAGFGEVVVSSELTPRIGLLERATTAAAEAALAPVLGSYLREVGGLLDEPMWLLSSAGGLGSASGVSAVDALLSGPAGGVVGAARVAASAGVRRAIALDMGGTSTDVARIDGAADLRRAHTVGGVTVARPAVDICTVAAGGGSVCGVEDGRLIVGPRSAGARPGPACYGAGGPLTLTDANLLLGRLVRERFEVPIDEGAARAALSEVAGAAGSGTDADALLAGFVDLACERTSEAVRSISARRGFDPAEHALVAFGGAGPQVACAVADRLGVREVIVPADASLLSAVGLESARVERSAERDVVEPLARAAGRLDALVKELAGEARSGWPAGTATGRSERAARAFVRLIGQDAALEIDALPADTLDERFREMYGRVHGSEAERDAELVGVRVTVREAAGESGQPARAGVAAGARERDHAVRRRVRVHDGSGWVGAEAVERSSLAAGDGLDGPALVVEGSTTLWLPPGWRAEADAAGSLRCVRTRAGDHDGAWSAERPVAVRRELVVSRLSSIAEQMGEALGRAAVSTNVKERLDYSCGVLDGSGELVASAPHIPVHLGALGAAGRAMLAALGPLGPGDAAVTNHPAFGGSHLPDVTVLEPVFDAGGGLLAHVISRAHHAEIGGVRPGSMPPGARSLAEEGVPIRPMLLRAGRSDRLDEVMAVLRSHTHPTRSLADNRADLRAALAAGERARAAVATLAREVGPGAVRDAMAWIVEHTEALVRRAVGRLSGLPASAEERLDGGSVIRARLDRSADGSLVIDLAGTSPQRAGSNLHAPLAVTRSAAAYVARLLVDRPVPLNDGLLRSVVVDAPEGSLVRPRFDGADDRRSPAVAGGNVETSQRLVEALVRALGLAAGSQGTMNNVLIGSEDFGVYETLGGGAGATSRGPGGSAVHVHMTNTAVTDAEVLEHRHPLRVERFAVRRGSGGAGVYRGGDGLVRAVRALQPVRLSVVTQRRDAGAPGLAGGGPGLPGRQWIERGDGSTDPLAAADTADLRAGDRLVIETPGGGGWRDTRRSEN